MPIIYRAHEGAGRAYIALEDWEVEPSQKKSQHWKRWAHGTLPGVGRVELLRDDAHGLVAEAALVGVLELPRDSFTIRYGHEVAPADKGIPVRNFEVLDFLTG